MPYILVSVLVTNDTVVHAQYNLWPAVMYSDGDEQGNGFEGFSVTSENKMMPDLLTYRKYASSQSVSKLKQVAIIGFSTDTLVISLYCSLLANDEVA